MKKVNRRAGRYLLVFACLTGFASMPALAADNVELAENATLEYETFTLENGLTTIVHTNKSTPHVMVGMWYMVGSKDEPPGKTGFAHLFEHLMFRETGNRSGPFFDVLAEAGASNINGSTNFDRTNYFSIVPSAALDVALWMESDRMIHLLEAVDEASLDNQREVVKNEKRQRSNAPYSGVQERMLVNLFPVDHPYRHSPIGSMEDLNAASVEDMHQWFEEYYGASNAFLVLSGDVDVDVAREKVQQYFGAAPAGKPLLKHGQWIPDLASNRYEVLYDNVPQPRISRTWTLPPGVDKDTALIKLVSSVLTNGKNSVLHKKLVDELQWATSVSSSVGDGLINSLFRIRIEVTPGTDPDDVRLVVDETLAQYLASGPEQEMIDVEKIRNTKRQFYTMDSAISAGFLLAQSYEQAGDPGHFAKVSEWTESASVDEITDVGRKWLSRPFFEITVLPFDDYASAETDADRSSIPVVGEVDTTIEFPQIHTATLSNGVRLVFAKRGIYPLSTIAFKFDGGFQSDEDGNLGALALAFDLLQEGTQKHSAEDLSRKLDSIGFRLWSSVKQASSLIEYDVLSRNLDESFELMAEILQSPAFSSEDLEKLKGIRTTRLESRKQDPGKNLGGLFLKAIFGGESRIGRMGSVDMVSALTRADVIAAYDRIATPDNLTVFLTGDLEVDEVVASLDRSIGKWRKPSVQEISWNGDALPKAPRVILVDKPGSTQSTIMVGHALPKFDADRDASLELLNAVLGGSFLARMNMNLREDKGWSYGVGSQIARDPLSDQYIAVYGSFQTDKTKESMMEVRKEYREFVSSRPVTEAELELNVKNKTRSLQSRLSSASSILTSMSTSADFGLPLDYEKGAAGRINAVELDELNALARDLINPDSLTWLIVGDLEKIAEDVRSLGYGPVEIWDAFGNPVQRFMDSSANDETLVFRD